MNNVNRRDFLRVLGWGGATVSLTACGGTSIDTGAETVRSYSEPEDFNIPGVGVYYASTCTQCGAGCGIVGKVREGRVLKIEGNPESGINHGRLCGLGQASVQHHYNPDRLREPMLRKDGALKAVSWDEAMKVLQQRTDPAAGRLAVVTGPVSGHLRVLLEGVVESLPGASHYAYDPLSNRANRLASEAMFGTPVPRLRLDQAQLIVSFGADFLDTWVSPVHFAGQYAAFRKASDAKPRGVLVQIEPRMTLTGANADRWVPIRPGTEGVLALALAHALLDASPATAHVVPDAIAAAARAVDPARVTAECGVPAPVFEKLVALLKGRTPSVVLSGPSAEGHAHGTGNAAAILALNWVLGNVGKTVQAPARLPFPQLAPLAGDSAALHRFADGLAAGSHQTVLFHEVNPLYTAPPSMQLAERLGKAQFRIACAQYLDETARACDLVLPMDSALEDWGTHVADYPGDAVELTLQQPLMERLYPDGTRSFGELLLSLLKARKPDAYKGFPDYYAYLKSALTAHPDAFVDAPKGVEEFWNAALAHGVLHIKAEPAPLAAKLAAIGFAAAAPVAADPAFPLRLAPAVRSGLRDGRHANLPWMQETPDSLSTVVWDSWAEFHPATAARLGIAEGDIVEVASAAGTLKVQAFLFPGLHPDVIGVPLGQGHTAMGRYADGRGVNPFAILAPVFDAGSGDLALYATAVKVARTGASQRVIKDEGWKEGAVKTQSGRKLVVTLAADQAQLSKEV